MSYLYVNFHLKDKIMTKKKTEELFIEDEDNPCKLICSMERESGFCFGCGRTQDEISYWSEMTYDKKTEHIKHSTLEDATINKTAR